MANISDAFGTVSIDGDWSKQDVEDLVYLLISQTYGEYSIYSSELETSRTFNKLVKRLLEGEEMNFSGTGRWAFECNLESLHRWSEIDEQFWKGCMSSFSSKKKISFRTYMKRRKRLIASMKAKRLMIKWVYKDFESGVGYMLETSGIHTVNDKDELVFSVLETTYFEYNLKTYCEEFIDDDDRLSQTVFDTAKHLKLDTQSDSVMTTIAEVIKAHPTWYDLGIYDSDYFEDDGMFPAQLGKDVMKAIIGEKV